MPYFHQCTASIDPHKLLNPDEHYSTPWGEPDHGPCDKCGGEGRVSHRCLSCMETGPDPACEACEGRIEWENTCPACLGDGLITNTTRQGVSVFPTLAGLYRYLVERDFDFSDEVIVELEGHLSDEPDLDADDGALLIHPTEIITRHPVDFERIEDLKRRLV